MVELRDVGWAGLLHHRGDVGGGPAKEAVPHSRAAPLLLIRPPGHPQGGDQPGVVQEVKTVRLVPELPTTNQVPPHCFATGGQVSLTRNISDKLNS